MLECDLCYGEKGNLSRAEKNQECRAKKVRQRLLQKLVTKLGLTEKDIYTKS